MRDQLSAIPLWLTSGFRASPALAVLALALRVGTAIAPPFQVYGLKLIIDGTFGRDPDLLVTGIMIISTALVATLITESFERAVSQTMIDEVHTYLTHGVITTTAGIPGIEHHEHPEIADRIELLRKESVTLTFSFTNLVGMIAAVANAVVVLGILVGIHPALLVLPLLGGLRVWASVISGQHQWRAKETTAQHTRRANQFAAIASSPRNGLDVRVFGMRDLLLKQIDRLLGVVESERRRAASIGARYEIAARLGFGAAYAGSIVFVALQTQAGGMSLGNLALIVLLGARVEQTASSIADSTRSTGQTVRAFRCYAWLRRYARESSPSGRTTAPRRLTRGISVSNASFQYPGATTPVLRDLTLDLPAGATVAIVGENGAGKSTLVKLLAKLYEPTSGVIMVDGHDLADIDPGAWRAKISAAFQDFVRYELTAREVVGVGDLARLQDEQAIRAALRRSEAGQLVESLPSGLDTQLGRQFTAGVDLSGGQWQRLALARAFMRTKPLLLILDEPTAALDPETEYSLFRLYAQAASKAAVQTGGITILVSHRFSTVRMADLILVMHNGQILETGSHADLITNGGLYTELFELQARPYQTKL